MVKMLKGIGRLFLGMAVGAGLVIGAANAAVCLPSATEIVTEREAASFGADCILVLGAAVYADGTPSAILQDRLDVAARLYRAGIAPKVIVSGNDSDDSHNEARAMKAYLVLQGVPEADVLCDAYGLTTYDSAWRARAVFGAHRIVVATQTYHLYRALFDARGAGLEARGIACDARAYQHQVNYDFREVFARVKDAGLVLVHAPSTTGRPASRDDS